MQVNWARKLCPQCKTMKPRCEWGRNRSRPDGLDWRCRECVRKYNREWKKNNPNKAAAAAAVVSKREKRRRAARAKPLANPTLEEIAAETTAMREQRVAGMMETPK